MSANVIRNWQDRALTQKCNFCAIEVGEEAKSDTELPGMLHAHVPQGADLYFLQRNEHVSKDEMEQVLEILSGLEILVTCNGPLNADDENTLRVPVLDEVEHPARVEGEDVAAVRQRIELNQMESFRLSKDIQELEEELLRVRIEAGLSPEEEEEEEEEKPTTIMAAFNELQFSDHWQAVAGTPAAKAVYRTMEGIYSLDEEAQGRIKGLLHTLLLGMRDDPGTLRSVLEAGWALTVDMTCVHGFSKMCIAYMEHRVASGALDDQPQVALVFARCVQRYTLLEDTYAKELKAERDSETHSALFEIHLRTAFDEALIAVLRDGGERGLPPQKKEDMTPGEAAAADIVQAAWQEMLQRGNEGFQ